MTFKEKLQMEHPEMVDKRFGGGGVKACPYHYRYEKDLNCVFWDSNEKCEECWNREMPNTEEFIEPKCTFETEVENAYNQGLNDAWELAQKIWSGKDSENVEIFGTKFVYEIYQLSPQEVLAKLKAYEEQSKIEVGDVVILDDEEYVITRINKTPPTITISGLNAKGEAICWSDNDYTKTGKHIDIKSILEQIGD